MSNTDTETRTEQLDAVSHIEQDSLEKIDSLRTQRVEAHTKGVQHGSQGIPCTGATRLLFFQKIVIAEKIHAHAPSFLFPKNYIPSFLYTMFFFINTIHTKKKKK